MKYRHAVAAIMLASQSHHVPVSALEIGQIFGFEENNYRFPNENDLFGDLETTQGSSDGSKIAKTNTPIAQGSGSGNISKGKGKYVKGDEDGGDNKCCSCTCFDPSEYSGGSNGDDGDKEGYYSGYNDDGEYCECSCFCGSKATMPLIPTVAPVPAPTTAPIEPTLSPTIAPTAIPTATPTVSPPTATPTILPTASPTDSPMKSPTEACEIRVETDCKRVVDGASCRELPIPDEGSSACLLEQICFEYNVTNIGPVVADITLLKRTFGGATNDELDNLGRNQVQPGETNEFGVDCVIFNACNPGDYPNTVFAQADPNCQDEDLYLVTVPEIPTTIPTASPTSLPTTCRFVCQNIFKGVDRNGGCGNECSFTSCCECATGSELTPEGDGCQETPSPPSPAPTGVCEIDVDIICQTDNGVACEDLDLTGRGVVEKDCKEAFHYTHTLTNDDDTLTIAIESLVRNFNGNTKDFTSNRQQDGLIFVRPGKSVTIREKMDIDLCSDGVVVGPQGDGGPRALVSYETTIEAQGSLMVDDNIEEICTIEFTVVFEL